MSWLLAYDIAAPQRWRPVYRRVADNGHRLQFSLWWLPITDIEMGALLMDLSEHIDPVEDDIRAYPFPSNAWCNLWGPPPWGKGLTDQFSSRFAPAWKGIRLE